MRNYRGPKIVETALPNIPIPVPEPPRVVHTRFLVPDLSLSSDIVASPSPSKYISNYNLAHNKRKHGNELNDKRIKFDDQLPLKRKQFENRDNLNASNSTLIKMLKSQDEQLERISKQIEDLLKLHECCKVKPKMHSVETMTSLIKNDGNENRSPTRKLDKQTKKYKQKNKELIERKNNSDKEILYDRMLLNISDNVNEILRNSESSFDDDEDDDENEFQGDIEDELDTNKRYSNYKRNSLHRQNKYSEQTLIINELANKYLIKGNKVIQNNHLKSNQKSKRKISITEIRQSNQHTSPYEFTSIATKNYLEKYGLLNRI